MTLFVKKMLLWLLVAILPVQGMAAILKANCGPRHHAVSIEVSVETDLSIERKHAHHKGHASGEMPPEIGLVQKEAVANEGSRTTPATDHYASYCSACATCCTGATAPPASISAISATDNAAEVAAVPAVSYPGFIPPGLERPPKPFSA